MKAGSNTIKLPWNFLAASTYLFLAGFAMLIARRSSIVSFFFRFFPCGFRFLVSIMLFLFLTAKLALYSRTAKKIMLNFLCNNFFTKNHNLTPSSSSSPRLYPADGQPDPGSRPSDAAGPPSASAAPLSQPETSL